MSQGNGRVLKISEDKISSPLDDLFKKNRPFPSLVSSCIVPGKGLIFTDSYLNQALLLSEEAGKIGEFNNQKELSQPTGIAYSVKTSQVWIVETAAHRISIFNLEGNFIKSIGSRGSGEGEFNFPTHIWIDEAGTAYVVDALNCRIQIFDGTGKYISSFGKAGNATGSIARPKGIATDSYGNIYIADALFNAIQIFDNTGKFLYYFGSQGSEHGEFWMPAGIFIDHKNYIYVSDSFNNRIQVFHLRKSE